MARYISHHNQPLVLGNQANYGASADLTIQQAHRIRTHYGRVGVLRRITQYARNHQTYVNAAHQTGRPLTDQELAAQQTGANAPNASINHIIASGTGQNILNRSTDQFVTGRARTLANINDALNPAAANHAAARLAAIHGLADQVASAARIQGYNRGIIQHRHGENLANTPTNQRIYGAQAGNQLDVMTTRNQALHHTLNAFQGPNAGTRYQAYRDVMRISFDSPGNLRVGDAYGNNRVSTGFDPPTRFDGTTATPRALSLLQTHTAYSPNQLLTPNRLFSRDVHGNVLSSSRWAPPHLLFANLPRRRKKRPHTDGPPPSNDIEPISSARKTASGQNVHSAPQPIHTNGSQPIASSSTWSPPVESSAPKFNLGLRLSSSNRSNSRLRLSSSRHANSILPNHNPANRSTISRSKTYSPRNKDPIF